MKITIDTHNCSREELSELKEYLEKNSWDFTTDKEEEEEEEEPKFLLREDGIHILGSHFVKLNEKITSEQLHEYEIRDRESFIDDLTGWIGESTTDKELMKSDLKMLMNETEAFMLSSNSTNAYIFQGESEFNETCKELLDLNETLSE